jgi:hypothetical protein
VAAVTTKAGRVADIPKVVEMAGAFESAKEGNTLNGPDIAEAAGAMIHSVQAA